MRTVTYNYQGYKGEAIYSCRCSSCGKTLKRKAVVEHTVNPFNKNDDGTMRSPAQVSKRAYEEACAEAAKLEGSEVICKTCEELPMKELLLEMAAEPSKVFPAPEKYWNSPLHVLVERKHADLVYVRSTAEEYANGAHAWQMLGYRINSKGIDRAKKFKD
jgi:hypothetical protein